VPLRLTDKLKLIEQTLRATRLFGGWPEPRIHEAVAAAELWQYSEGEIVAERYDTARGLWVVAAGSLTSYRDSPAGRHMVGGLNWPGDVIGLLPMLDGHVMPHSHSARTSSLLVLIPAATMRAILRADTQALASTAHFAAMRNRTDYEALYTKTIDTKRCQLAKYLAYLPRRAVYLSEGAPGDKGWIDPAPLDVTQDELAAMLGVARQTINRLMTPFLRDKILERKGNAVRVVSFKRLLAIIEEDEQVPEQWRAELLSWDEHLRETKAKDRTAEQSAIPRAGA
jgi:CRP/FNR family cyclic AMP-dependent transcriptional regulator